MRALIDHARRESFECVSLNVEVTNARAIKLYRKLGFEDATPPGTEPHGRGVRYMELRPG